MYGTLPLEDAMTCARSHPPARWPKPGFSLVELVMVVTIIGIIAAIAVPHVSQATSRASSNALELSVTNVRKAIDEYYAEHGKYPGYVPGTTTPDGDSFVEQLLMYTNRMGDTNSARG